MASDTQSEEEIFAYAVLGMDEHIGLGAVSANLDEMVARGEQWLLVNRTRLQDAVCSNATVRDFIAKGDMYSAVALLMQLVPDLLPAKAAALALLVAKGLLAAWCRQGPPP